MRQKQVDFAYFTVFFLCVATFAVGLLSMWNIRRPKGCKTNRTSKNIYLVSAPVIFEKPASRTQHWKTSIFGWFYLLFCLPLFFSKSTQSESRPFAGALASDLCPEIPPRTSSWNKLLNLYGVCENQRFFCNRVNSCTNSRFLRCYSSDLRSLHLSL